LDLKGPPQKIIVTFYSGFVACQECRILAHHSFFYPPEMAGALWKVSQEPIHKHFLPKVHPKVKILAMKGKETVSIYQ